MQFEAIYHDGETSNSELVTVGVSDEGEVSLSSLSTSSSSSSHFSVCSWHDLKVTPRIANTPRWIGLPNGAQIETLANDLVDQLQDRYQSDGFNRLLHSLEHSWGMILAGVLFMVVFVWGGIQYGLPAAAKYSAEMIPEDILYPLGDDVVALMDEEFFEPSQLSQERKEQIEQQFQRLMNHQQRYQLLFRASPKLGANALALPNDHVILTDELVELATHDYQIIAVLAHEVGHLEYKHSLRRLLQQAGLASILMVFAGDVSTVSSAVIYLPAILVELGYSRAFEHEADEYALNFLEWHGIDTDYFAQMLTLLAESNDDGSDEAIEEHVNADANGDDQSKDYLRYLSTHPGVDERIQRIRHREQGVIKP